MVAQKGKDLLLKLDQIGDQQTFTTVAGLRSKSISFSTGTVDVTHSMSPGQWRELLECGGVKQGRVSGSGVFKDDASDEMVRQLFFGGLIRPWQIIIPDFGTIQGLFQISGLEFAGDHDGEVRFEMTLESAGELSFTAA